MTITSTSTNSSAETEKLLAESHRDVPRKVIVWTDICASVPNGAKAAPNPHGMRTKEIFRKTVLRNVTGVAFPGEILAIMGGSGAGKTTLLNILTSNRQKDVQHTGVVMVNGEEVDDVDMRRMSAFVQQMDLFCGTLTVREQLLFSAQLRMNRSYSYDERVQRVDQVITEMNLVDSRNTKIGIPGRTKGISVGEKKRLAFACETLTDPPILFCDEPTSGLDSFMAQQVVAALRRLADSGKTIITVIHQPSAEVFEMFHRVCFMARGSAVYHGKVKNLCPFLDSTGDPHIAVPYDSDPADHMIKVLSVETETYVADQARIEKIIEAYHRSPEKEKLDKIVHGELTSSIRRLKDEGNKELRKKPRYAVSFWSQFFVLMHRSFLTTLRDPLLTKIKIIQIILTAAAIGVVNWRIELRGETVMNVEGVLFNTARDMNFLFLFPSMNIITAELPIFIREYRGRIYSVESFYWAKAVAETPQYTIMPLLYSVIVYFMIGLYPAAEQFCKFALVCVLQAYVATSIAMTGACIFGDEGTAITFLPLFVLPMLIFGGFYISYEDIPLYFQWLSSFSWFRMGFEALQINEWRQHERIEGCPPPAGSRAYCRADSGQEVLINRSMAFTDAAFWVDIGILLAIFVFARLLGLLALKLRAKYGK